jgi:FKBP-type peptidyl-prolyl cis-trans isomerase 2
MNLQKGDFISIDFTGKVKDGEVFDSTIKEDLEELHKGHGHEIKTKPFIFALGRGMFLDALDNLLIGKEIGKDYEIEINPDQGFGKRESTLVKMIPIKIFLEQKINPIPGVSLNFDGRVGKILTVSGGRVMIDFNHPLAGKTLEYKIKVLKKIEDVNEKINALNEFFFRKDLKFEVKEKKLIIEADKQFSKVVSLFTDKFKEILDLDLEVVEVEEKKGEGEKQASAE